MKKLREKHAQLAGVVALTAAGALLVLLSVRTITSIDIGYHLAYGEQFWQSGTIVDHNDFLYTLPPGDLPAAQRPEPGPGCWYDAEGRYRFPNANWLSQVIMSGAWHVCGVWGLSLLRILLVAAVGALLILTMSRWRVPLSLTALGIVLFAVVGFSRFNLRPELFGYVVLAAQFALLAKPMRDAHDGVALTWRRGVALGFLQLLLVNLHSYFLLGLALTGALLVEQVVHAKTIEASSQRSLHLRAAKVAALVLFAQVVVCFANPWTWRLAVLPFQTLVYLREHGITEGSGEHPWSNILEFFPTTQRRFLERPSDYAICAMWGLAAVGAVGAALRRRWTMLLVMAGMTAVSVSMRRNVAVAALVLIPVSIASVSGLFERLARKGRPKRGRAFIVGLAVLLASVFVGSAVVSNQFYVSEGQSMRFGLGLSRAVLPIGAARWLDEHQPGGRVWCDMTSSSTLRFFTHPHRELPILTNTWAYPLPVMVESIDYRAAKKSFDELVAKYRIDAVVLRADWSRPLYKRLVRNPRWALVHLEGFHAVLARWEGEMAGLSEKALDLRKFDRQAWVSGLADTDPLTESSLMPVGENLMFAAMPALAVVVFDEATKRDPSLVRAWNNLGMALTTRGWRRYDDRDAAYKEDFDRARRCYKKALKLDPTDQFARKRLRKLSDGR